MIESFRKPTVKQPSPTKARKKLIHLMHVSDKLIFPKQLRIEILEIYKEAKEKAHGIHLARLIFK